MLTSETANRFVDAAVAKAEELGVAGSVAVVDAGGHLKAFVRMDGSVLGASDGAQRKAHTAVTSGMSTSQWFQIVTGDAGFGAIVGHGTEGTLFLPGGEPIVGADGIEGAIGFSGGQPDQDAEIVASALSAAAA
jgi:uncharacterized protein GlcG (DUF336 family)